MARSKIFESWTFKLAMPAPFDNPSFTGSKDFGLSRYNTAGALRKSTLHAPCLRALLAYARLILATDSSRNTDGLGAVGHQNDTFRIAEYKSANKTDCVVFNRNTGKFIVGQFPDGTDSPKPYTMGPGNASGSALFFALMPEFDSDTEFHDCFNMLKTQMEDGWTDMDSALETALILCDNMYRRIEGAASLGQAGIKIAIPATGNISTLSNMALSSGNYAPTGILYGEFSIIKPGQGARTPAKAISHSEFVGQYALNQRMLTQREEAMVPKLPDWYIIPKEVVRICEHAKLTTNTSQPMRNFLMRGPAGTGKTMGAQAIAAGLHLPYMMMTCSANTEISDLIGQFIPDTTGLRTSEAPGLGQLPKISDIIMHPPSVYEELTGVYDDDKTDDDVLQKLIEIAVGRIAAKDEKPGQRIRYVDTPLIEAIRHGYLIELQERATRS